MDGTRGKNIQKNSEFSTHNPFQVKRGQYSFSSDVYSMGLVLFELFERCLPAFDQNTGITSLPKTFQVPFFFWVVHMEAFSFCLRAQHGPEFFFFFFAHVNALFFSLLTSF